MRRLKRIRLFGPDPGADIEVEDPPVSRVKNHKSEQLLTGMKAGSKLILFVEDDPQVRDFGLLILRGAGYEVAAAESSAQAQRLWDRQGGKFDVLVADMMIPNCSTGLELARRFRRANSGLPVIITSGFGPEIAGDQAAELKSLTFLRKPFKPEELLKAVSVSLRATVR